MYQGVQELIPVQKSNLDHLVSVEGTEEVTNTGPLELLAEVVIPVEGLDRRSLERTIEDSVQLVRADEEGMQIAYVAQDTLFEQIGLRIGDTILSVNGNSVVTQNLLADTPDEVLEAGTLDLEILRDGARKTLKVNFDQG